VGGVTAGFAVSGGALALDVVVVAGVGAIWTAVSPPPPPIPIRANHCLISVGQR
jgi:hypothetical protein